MEWMWGVWCVVYPGAAETGKWKCQVTGTTEIEIDLPDREFPSLFTMRWGFVLMLLCFCRCGAPGPSPCGTDLTRSVMQKCVIWLQRARAKARQGQGQDTPKLSFGSGCIWEFEMKDEDFPPEPRPKCKKGDGQWAEKASHKNVLCRCDMIFLV